MRYNAHIPHTGLPKEKTQSNVSNAFVGTVTKNPPTTSRPNRNRPWIKEIWVNGQWVKA